MQHMVETSQRTRWRTEIRKKDHWASKSVANARVSRESRSQSLSCRSTSSWRHLVDLLRRPFRHRAAAILDREMAIAGSTRLHGSDQGLRSRGKGVANARSRAKSPHRPAPHTRIFPSGVNISQVFPKILLEHIASMDSYIDRIKKIKEKLDCSWSKFESKEWKVGSSHFAAKHSTSHKLVTRVLFEKKASFHHPWKR